MLHGYGNLEVPYAFVEAMEDVIRRT